MSNFYNNLLMARRSREEKQNLEDDVAAFIGIGIEQATSTRVIASQFSNYSLASQSQGAFQKEIERACLYLFSKLSSDESDTANSLQRIASKGSPTRYYWVSKEEKHAFLDKFTITTPRALALSTANLFLNSLLPTSFYETLSSDFEKASVILAESGLKVKNIFEFSPQGLPINLVQPNESEQSKLDMFFKAIVNKRTIKAYCKSIHPQFNDQWLVLSPQKIKLITGQVQVACIVHPKGQRKNFELYELKYISFEKAIYRCEKDDDHQQELVKLRCHDWVKEHLHRLALLSEFTVKKVADNVSEVSFYIGIPKHFNDKNHDPFYIANYLMSFADSVVVLEPEYLRQEMLRRVNNLAKAYNSSEKSVADKIVNSSTQEMTREEQNR